MPVDVIIWIAAASIASLLVAIWALYKLFELCRPASSPAPANLEAGSTSFASSAASNTNNYSNNNNNNNNVNSSFSSGLTASSSFAISPRRVDGVETIGYRLAKSNLSPKQALETVKSIKLAKVGSDKSDGSRKSFGFEPLVKRYKGNNFLAILDQINALDEEEEQRRLSKRDRRIRTASSVGLDVDSTDETGSQTFIGKALNENQTLPDPGRIQLGFIMAQQSGESSSEADDSPAPK